MEKRKTNYGVRVCIECGKEFTALYAQQVCCKAECQKQRTLKRDRNWHSRNSRKYSDFNWLNGQYERALEGVRFMAWRIQELMDALDTASASLKAKEEELSLVADVAKGNAEALQERTDAMERMKKEFEEKLKAANKGKVSGKSEIPKAMLARSQKCLRANISALNLPCGKKDICFRGGACKKAVEDLRPKPEPQDDYDNVENFDEGGGYGAEYGIEA